MLTLTEYVRIMISLIVVLDPIGIVPLFLSMTSDYTPAERHRTAWVAALTVAVVLIVAAFVGDWLLALFGIRIATFRVGGGILILLMAISMLHARVSGSVQTPEEAREAKDKDAVAVVPLAIPLMAGPGAISAVIIASHHPPGGTGSATHLAALSGIILLVSAIAWLALRLGAVIQPRLGRIGINVITRLMGLILAAVAVEFIVAGVSELFPALTAPAK